MQLREARCPACNASVQVPYTDRQLKCMYCGADLFVDRPAQSGPSAHALLSLANVAVHARNYKEAHGYFTRALELEPQNAHAWYGKGLSAGSDSTLQHFRVQEMAQNLRTAIHFAPNDEARHGLAASGAIAVMNIANMYFEASVGHFMSFSNVHEALLDFVGAVHQVIDALVFALELSPNSVPILQFGVSVTQRSVGAFGMVGSDQFAAVSPDAFAHIHRFGEHVRAQLQYATAGPGQR